MDSPWHLSDPTPLWGCISGETQAKPFRYWTKAVSAAQSLGQRQCCHKNLPSTDVLLEPSRSTNLAKLWGLGGRKAALFSLIFCFVFPNLFLATTLV